MEGVDVRRGRGPADVVRFRRRILAWYDAQKRDLPWRHTRDPYAIWVSEIMLQQTRVDVVVPYYARWMRRFPTVASLAAAKEETVLAMWAGLGYYRRARDLHSAARRLDGALPRTRQAWEALPGVGPYTSAAIASIANGEAAAAVDGNVERVAARILAIRAPRTPGGRTRIAEAADTWLARTRPGDWNQALMDLGATVCTPKAPKCGSCPVADSCGARARGQETAIPAGTRKSAPKAEGREFVLLRKAGKVLLTRQAEGLLAGMWLLPGGSPRAGRPLRALVARQTGFTVAAGPVIAKARHRFSHRAWDMSLRSVEAWTGRARGATRWLEPAGIGKLAVPAAMVVLLKAAGLLHDAPPLRRSKTKAASSPPT